MLSDAHRARHPRRRRHPVFRAARSRSPPTRWACALLQLGVISAIDMTTGSACVTKIAYLYGRGLRGAALRDAMAEDLRGEITFRPQEQPSLLERL